MMRRSISWSWCLALAAVFPAGSVSDLSAQEPKPKVANAPVLINDVDPNAGFTPIFNGQNLEGWRGENDYWRVENGAIVGEAKDKPLDHNTFLVWDLGEVDDFEMRLQFRLTGSDEKAANSGIQFRSQQLPDGHVVGYQADMDIVGNWVGALYDEHGRGLLATRGQKVAIDKEGKRTNEALGDAAKLFANLKKGEWNEYTIIARGPRVILKLNGETTVDLEDNERDPGRDPNKQGERKGLFALQLHSGPPQKVEFKDIRLKRLPLAEGKKIVFVAGRPSHGHREHEHNAGCRLLAAELDKAAEAANVPLLTTVYTNGFPKDLTAFDNANTVISYCDGGGGHYLMPVLKDFDKVMDRGVGLVCLHYSVEIPAGEPGNYFLKWIGGYFEANWSVNPHWTAKFDKLPDHPITRGVKPFEINDEWYYHMRFRPNMEEVTPILTALPPRDTLSRPDGPHSGNPAVRQNVLEKKEPQHMAWAANRKDGIGRGFGFTGGHFHRNWQNDDFRTLVLNAIAWTAHAEVPPEGLKSPTPTAEQMDANLDPKGQANKPAPAPAAAPQAAGKPGAKPVASSPIVSPQTPGHSVVLEADITGAKQLYLVVTDGGDGFGCDWADWAEPRLIGADGEKKLTELKWKEATADFGEPQVGKNNSGGELIIGGKPVSYGIGTHANSVIRYDLPEGHKYTKFKSSVGIDHGGSGQGCGSTVQFYVFTQAPPAGFAAGAKSPGGGQREPTVAVAQLDVAEGLEATLFAAEPTLLSPSDIDVDHLGRVWVCEVVNYRHRNGERPEGDRILVLEDTDQDGVSDKTTVFYQGHEVDTAHGIGVFGNRVIVSVGDKVWSFFDDNGDLKADRKELMFSGISGTQHDHGIHAFIFGPDGKLYFNYGNAGRSIQDKDGKPIVDKAGNEINDSRKPYQEGMVFRCDLDGSNMETLGWNFRNNWEVTVDSFGSLWQSDNDDDGNRGVRINFVMEYGNYGYRDEMNGAGWQSPRTNIEQEIPLRHWHLNDPGVMPNLLQTGGGAPTGICIYEGTLLPKLFQNQIIHCDAGPNVVRAYPAKSAGAGYTAEMVNVLFGARDNWFRPSDVCTAPDGSLIISDWYDPGVGGHRMGDADKGRIFRVAPPGTPYKNPKYDFSTAEGAVNALKSPNMEARYLAWQALHKMGPQAEAALQQLAKDANPRFKARALWLLGKQDDSVKATAAVKAALADSDPDIRIVGIRLARQLAGKIQLADIHDAVNIQDPSPAVRREILVGLRELKLDEHAELAGAWAMLAEQYDGQDRWYLEALGIAADGRWDPLLDAWLGKVGPNWNTPAGRDIVWRSRSSKTPALLAKIIADQSTRAADLPRYFRALDFLTGSSKDQTVLDLAFGEVPGDDAKKTLVMAEAVDRLQAFDINSKPEYKAILARILDAKKGSVEYVKLVEKFDLKDHFADLVALLQSRPEEQIGVEAVRSLLSRGQQKSLAEAARGNDSKLATATVTAIGLAADGRARQLLTDLMNDEAAGLDVRRAAVRGLGNVRQGAEGLLKVAQEGKFDPALKDALASTLASIQWNDLKQQAAKIFPAPPSRNNEAIPPIDQLLTRKGDVANGRFVFNTSGTCNKCHVVNDIGREIGPNLSEIGKKLSRQALFESILYPSAGISHNYESYTVVTTNGEVLTGLIVSDTADELTLRDSNALTRTIKKSDVEEKRKQQVSLMPADLQKLITVQELVDVVDYLQTLKTAVPKAP